MKECHVCISAATKKEKSGLLQNFEPPMRPFERIAVDWIGPLEESVNGNIYALVIVDHYTRFPLVYPAKENSAAVFARIIMEQVEPLWGPPETILSDQGAELRGMIAREMWNMMNTRRLVTTAYHPKTNGMTERFNGTLKAAINKFIAGKKKEWETYIPYVLSVYRKTVHEVTGFSPHELLYGSAPRTGYDLLWRDVETEENAFEEVKKDFLNDVHKFYAQRRESARGAVRLAQRQANAEAKAQYDKGRVARVYKIGEQIFLLEPQKEIGGSFDIKKKGPYTIIGKGRTENNYIIERKGKPY
ncbi:transposase, partial [archaeon]